MAGNILQKALVTGAAGYIGTHLVQKLESLGCEVIPFDIKLDSSQDIRNAGSLDGLENCTIIYHLAALSNTSQCNADPQNAGKTNVLGTEHVANFAKEWNIPVIYTSSAAVYGNCEWSPQCEYYIPQPLDYYARTKFAGELAIKTASVRNCICRLFNVYGGYGANPSSIIERICTQDHLFIDGDGSQVRDFIHVDDVCDTLIKIGERLESPQWPRCVNIGTGTGTSILALATMGMITHDFIEKDPGVQCSVADIKLVSQLWKKPPKNILMGLYERLGIGST